MYFRLIIKKVKTLGFFSVLKFLLEKNYNKILRFYFRFDKWHTLAPYHGRIYKKIVVDLINDNISYNDTVLEIGCGLGDILSRVNSQNRYGFDISNRVLKAAKFKNNKKIIFNHGSINDVKNIASIFKIDIIVLVNWTHSIDGMTITNNLKFLDSIKPIKFILVDELFKTTSENPIYHTYSKYFKGFAKEIERSSDGESRNLVLYKVIE
tara:strand:+ start:35177 stop:35803 length:627 start_codon:yes stop_codon:yes gene_type:complete